MNYTKLLQKLYQVNEKSGIKLGLQNTIQLDAALGYPSKKFRSIHIAGSNGKGSVATKIAAGLQEEGFQVGLFTSPHISSFRERIRINGNMISEENVTYHLNRIYNLDLPATFFEITTALAFDYFAQSNVDYAVIETGLGGRYDATNILQPDLSIITSISLEHTQILGDTLNEIAKEKAGIIKANTPVILGPSASLISEMTSEPTTIIQGEFDSTINENCAIAIKAMEFLQLNPQSIESGLKAVPPCRMEILDLECPVILDVAHNPESLERLFSEIRKNYSLPIHVLCSFSKEKNIPECMQIIQKHASDILLLDIPHPRLASPELLLQEAPASSIENPRDALQHSFKKAQHQNGIIVVAGSFYIMSTIRSLLGVCDDLDPIELQENWGKSVNRVK